MSGNDVDATLYCPVGSWMAKYAITDHVRGSQGRDYTVGSFKSGNDVVRGVVLTLPDKRRIGLSSQIDPSSLTSVAGLDVAAVTQEAIAEDLEYLAQGTLAVSATGTAIELRKHSLQAALTRFADAMDPSFGFSAIEVDQSVGSVSIFTGTEASQRRPVIAPMGRGATFRDVVTGQRFAVTAGTWTDQAQEAMATGQCAGFAVAVNECTDWPVQGIFGREPGGRRHRLLHILTKMPDGRYFDSYGPATSDELRDGSDIDGFEIHPLSSDQVRSLLSGTYGPDRDGQLQRLPLIRTFVAEALEGAGLHVEADKARKTYETFPIEAPTALGL